MLKIDSTESSLALDYPQDLSKALGAMGAATIALSVPVFVFTRFNPPDLSGYIVFLPFVFLGLVGVFALRVGIQLLQGQRWVYNREQKQLAVHSRFLFSESAQTYKVAEPLSIQLTHFSKVRDGHHISEWYELTVWADAKDQQAEHPQPQSALTIYSSESQPELLKQLQDSLSSALPEAVLSFNKVDV